MLRWRQVFIWVGQDANETERKEVIPTSREFLRTHPGARDPDTPIILIKQGFEPLTFTGWFAAWDPFKWSVSVGRVLLHLIFPFFCIAFPMQIYFTDLNNEY